jgi:D-amino peptidase
LAILDHTWSSSRVHNLWINGRLAGETGLNAAVCGAFGAPVLLVTGDRAVCAEAADWLPGVDTVETKRATGRHSAECLPVAVSQERIRQGAEKALRRYMAGAAPAPLVISTPVELVIEFMYSDMADRAAIFPGAERLDGHRVKVNAPDMPLAYKSFRALVMMSNR